MSSNIDCNFKSPRSVASDSFIKPNLLDNFTRSVYSLFLNSYTVSGSNL